MIRTDNFIMNSDEEEARYKFGFCKQCDFYECELVGEYAQFKENHVKEPNSEASRYSSIVVEAKVYSEEDIDVDSCEVIQASHVYVDENNETEVKLSEITPNSLSTTEASGLDLNLLSYDQEKSKNGCIMSHRNVYPVECGNKSVTDGIGDHYKIEIGHDFKIKTDTDDRWEPSQPVFISAQTGSGKNYFVENILMPYLDTLNYKNITKYKILILSNRLALKHQIEERIKENDDSDDADSWIYSFSDNTDVMTYQSLLEKIGYLKKTQKRKDSRYVFVICDEAHFFTSDAMFNPHTQKILETIVRLFKDAVRVYMSATPYECLEYIIKYEEKINSHYLLMAFYHFKRDYSYLDINTYSDIKELYKEIVKSVNKGEKWLIFIDDKEKCKSVKEKLEEYGEKIGCSMVVKNENSAIHKIYAVDADSKDDKAYRSIIRNENLGKNTYVLITTSVLDNGVNLKDIDNIVISDMSKVKCLQMIGRARTKKKSDERKTLYIKRFDENYVKRRLDGFYKQRKAYHRYELAFLGAEGLYIKNYDRYNFLSKYYEGAREDLENAKHWFGRSLERPDELYLNEIAQSLLDKLIPRYEFILDEMKEEGEAGNAVIANRERKYVAGHKYLGYQLSWFGRKYSPENDMHLVDKEKNHKEFMNFLQWYASNNIHIDKEKKDAFREEFTERCDMAYQREDPNLGRNYGLDKMNKLLTEHNIGYEVKSEIIEKSRIWRVVKKD
ncbi:MAG: DEAD/DEAH box helicase family protein [Lachnospiraceae bacterium]|nr:DEAD/DEAH box helicase family protein [Lachnospiraceae bacterium]